MYAQLGCWPNICIISSLVFTWDAFKPKCVPEPLFSVSPQITSWYILVLKRSAGVGGGFPEGGWGGVVLCAGRESSSPAGRRDQSYSVRCVYAHMSLVGEALSEAVTLLQTSGFFCPDRFSDGGDQVGSTLYIFLMFSCWAGLNMRVKVLIP